MTVREAQPQDAAEVAGVNVRSWQVAYRGLFPDDYLDGLRAEDRMAHYTFGDGRPGSPATLVAVIDATICGFWPPGQRATRMRRTQARCTPSTSTRRLGDGESGDH